MVGLLGFTLNPWSKPTWFRLFRSMAHSLFYNCLSNCAKVQIVDNFPQNIIHENDSHIHVMSSFKWYFDFQKSMGMSPTSILCLYAQI